jgi:ATP-dependent Clp protease ATP-binding subunit ClpB
MANEQTIHLDRYTSDAKALVAGAQGLADERKHTQVEPIHLLARALDRDPGVAEVFRRAGSNVRDVASEAESALSKLPRNATGLAYVSQAFQSLLGRAEKEAGSGQVTTEHLLNALSQEIRGAAAVVLQAFSLGPGSLRPHMAGLTAVSREATTNGTQVDASAFTVDWVERAKRGEIDPIIGRDNEVRRLLQILERRQKQHPLLVGEAGVGKSAIVGALASRIAAGEVPHNLSQLRVLELQLGVLLAGARLRGEIEERLKQVIASFKKTDAVLYISAFDGLFGQQSSGVAELLKAALARGDLRLLATTTAEGLRKVSEKDSALIRQFSCIPIEPATVDQAIEVLRGVATRYEAHHGVQIGDPAILAAVNMAKRYVQDRALPDAAIDLLDESAARKRVELDGVPIEIDNKIRRLASLRTQLAALADDEDAISKKTRDRLQKEMAELEPTVTEMRSKLDSRKGAVAARNALFAEHARLQAQLEEARKSQDFAKLGELEHVQIPDVKRRLDTAEAAITHVGAVEASKVLTEGDVAAVLGDWTGIPVARMLESEADKLLRMEERLEKRIVGQAEAVRALSRAVRRGRVGLRDAGKPIGSFLFLGPSGVGKTELAKALAEFLFDDEQSMTRLDMSEFMEKHMAQRLVGAPPGYVDSEAGGFLTEAVRHRPYSVLLFDEVEKAHADVFNLLLQVLDDGRLTDGRGRTADFSNTVIIMTSNIGSKRLLEADPKLFESDDGREALRDVMMEDLRSFMRPEFLNRIDDVLLFRPLTKANLRDIVDIQLKRLDKLVEDRDLRVRLSDAAKDLLVDLGYEPAFGARPIKRAILKHLQDPLAEEILRGGYAPGQTIAVDTDGTTFKFSSSN